MKLVKCFYIIPGIPPPPIGGIGVGFSSGMSDITHSRTCHHSQKNVWMSTHEHYKVHAYSKSGRLCWICYDARGCAACHTSRRDCSKDIAVATHIKTKNAANTSSGGLLSTYITTAAPVMVDRFT